MEAASKHPYVYDPDCPLLTPEQLAEFRPVNYATMEERAQAMREARIFDPEDVGRCSANAELAVFYSGNITGQFTLG
jgi:hypothetical protein